MKSSEIKISELMKDYFMVYWSFAVVCFPGSVVTIKPDARGLRKQTVKVYAKAWRYYRIKFFHLSHFDKFGYGHSLGQYIRSLFMSPTHPSNARKHGSTIDLLSISSWTEGDKIYVYMLNGVCYFEFVFIVDTKDRLCSCGCLFIKIE